MGRKLISMKISSKFCNAAFDPFCSGIHVHVARGVQLFSRTEDRETEQKNGSLWKTVYLSTTMRGGWNAWLRDCKGPVRP